MLNLIKLATFSYVLEKLEQLSGKSKCFAAEVFFLHQFMENIVNKSIMKIIVYKDSDPVFTYGDMKTQCFDTSENTFVTNVFLTSCIMDFSELKYKENYTKVKQTLTWMKEGGWVG